MTPRYTHGMISPNTGDIPRVGFKSPFEHADVGDIPRGGGSLKLQVSGEFQCGVIDQLGLRTLNYPIEPRVAAESAESAVGRLRLLAGFKSRGQAGPGLGLANTSSLRACEICAGQVRAAQIHTAQVSVPKVCVAQVGINEAHPPHVPSLE
jgi:hypothetical protein